MLCYEMRTIPWSTHFGFFAIYPENVALRWYGKANNRKLPKAPNIFGSSQLTSYPTLNPSSTTLPWVVPCLVDPQFLSWIASNLIDIPDNRFPYFLGQCHHRIFIIPGFISEVSRPIPFLALVDSFYLLERLHPNPNALYNLDADAIPILILISFARPNRLDYRTFLSLPGLRCN